MVKTTILIEYWQSKKNYKEGIKSTNSLKNYDFQLYLSIGLCWQYLDGSLD